MSRSQYQKIEAGDASADIIAKVLQTLNDGALVPGVGPAPNADVGPASHVATVAP